MRVFVSYSAPDRRLAIRIAAALRAEGHEVFIDTQEVSPGERFTLKIRKAIDRSRVFVFLVSDHSLREGAYALSELDYAFTAPASRRPRILPVLLDGTAVNIDHSQLSTLSLLIPAGDTVADISNAISRLNNGRDSYRQRLLALTSSTAIALCVAVALHFLLPTVYGHIQPITEEQQIEWFTSQFSFAVIACGVAASFGLICFELILARPLFVDRLITAGCIALVCWFPVASSQALTVWKEVYKWTPQQVGIYIALVVVGLAGAIALIRYRWNSVALLFRRTSHHSQM